MTRSQQKQVSRREAFTKLARQHASHNQVNFSTAVNKITSDSKENVKTVVRTPVLFSSIRISSPHSQAFVNQGTAVVSTRRNPNRMHGNAPRGAAKRRDDDDNYDSAESDVDDTDLADDQERRPEAQLSISLLDIARPAKQKGPAKDFEIIPNLRSVISLEDDDDAFSFIQSEADEWERIYGSEYSFDQLRSYSSVLRQGGGDT